MSLIVHVQSERLTSCAAAMHVQFVVSGSTISTELLSMYPMLSTVAASRQFSGEAGTSCMVASSQEPLSYGVVLGLGKAASVGGISIEQVRRAAGSMIRLAQQLKLKTIALTLPDAAVLGADQKTVLHELLIAAGLASYEFDTYLSSKKQEPYIFELFITGLSLSAELEQIISDAQVTIQALNEAREWINTPPNDMYPERLAFIAQELAGQVGLSCQILGEKEIIALGMGGLASVSAGSARDCQLVTLQYSCGNPAAPTIGFVGKGITFDSGGLSLKPAQSMETMKDDMSGAAAVIAAMRVIAHRKPSVNVVAMAPLSENLPSGTSNKPGDIVRFYNGKTAEIKNTDAEGRLVLADALAYMVATYKPAAIIDVATLTGACVVALGPLMTGLFSEHEDMVVQVEKAAQKGCDPVWRLPLNADYAAAVKGDISDLCNIGKGNYKAGATMGAAFLQAFVGDTPWVHLDIAGSSFDVPGISYFRPNTATGSGLRILVEFAMNFGK